MIPKKHYPSYAFDLPPQALTDLMLATQKVAKLLDKAFVDVGRTGMFFEGFGVDHVHSKLIPLHDTANLSEWKPIESRQNKFFERYEGYLSSHNHERADDKKLAALAARIRDVQA
ncbi:diadenosine tetraphosphate (Ap4A) hydrolase [Salmonella enterica subsp. arizonae]|uniref:Diadenosine tetraphosphate (Ap4A) hydrolase n=1 Tax=Salmonella enterica subsp. arizonae TaxID=59203 RepID=A0A379TMY5_SALER|nr:diadenosine tetraphosphate (Ap4A) hydrolase [Salmonella enterica subsp. arizonae]